MMEKVMFLTGLKDTCWSVGEPDVPRAESVLPSSTQSFLGTIWFVALHRFVVSGFAGRIQPRRESTPRDSMLTWWSDLSLKMDLDVLSDILGLSFTAKKSYTLGQVCETTEIAIAPEKLKLGFKHRKTPLHSLGSCIQWNLHSPFSDQSQEKLSLKTGKKKKVIFFSAFYLHFWLILAFNSNMHFLRELT